MKLYLVQHAQAKPKELDPLRPLTDEGKASIQKMARFLSTLQLEIAEIRYSTKLRAKQTAEIVAQALGKEALLKETEGLSPNDPVTPLADELADADRPLMVVGHLPFLGKLVSRLLAGDENHEFIAFQNAGVVCLTKNENRWQVEWILPP